MNFENAMFKDRLNDLEAVLQNMQVQMQDKEEQLAITNSDKVRFKEISENYMKEVAHLEQQLEAASIKPTSKVSQRPKDTNARDVTQSLSGVSAQRVKLVDAKQLKLEVQLLKLFLQQKYLQADITENMAPILFGDDDNYEPGA